MKVTRFLHTAVPTLPYEKSHDFYTRVLGMNLAPRPEIPSIPGAWLGVEGKSEEVQIHIMGCEPLGQEYDPTRVHFALEVESLEDAMETLTTEGIPYGVITGLLGVSQLFLRDPSGNMIELQERPEKG